MKNFVKLIQQVHKERYTKVLTKLIQTNPPHHVAFLSLAPVNQAVAIVKELRAQGLNIYRLFVTDSIASLGDVEFDVVQVNNETRFDFNSEYVLTMGEEASRFAVKIFPESKILSINICKGNPDDIYEIFMDHLDDLREVYESLIDEESKKVFRGYWLGNISGQFNRLVFSNTPHYICAGFLPERGAIVIDGGLCDGGTALRFSQMGYEVYGFEMDKINYETSRKVGEENNFVVENLGLGSFKHNTNYTHLSNPGGSYLDVNGTETTQITTLDAYVREKNLPRVDYIKLDVEGSELDVLRGAATTIARFKPILALSAYHKWDDFWVLMNFVKSVRPDYEFAMRQFGISKEDGAYHFHTGREEALDRFGLRPILAGMEECVLLAR